MKLNNNSFSKYKGEAVSDILWTIVSIIVFFWFISSENDWNKVIDFFNNITTTQQVIEYDGQNK